MKDYSINGNSLVARDLSIRHTVESGQPLTFYADYDWGKSYLSYAHKNGSVKASFSEDDQVTKVDFAANGKNSAKEFANRFRLDEPLDRVYETIDTDAFMHGAIRRFNGMRLTRNDPWETTLCFILSQYNNIKKIRRSMLQMIDAFGNQGESKRFPRSEDLLNVSDSNLRKCGVGFRSKYILHAAEYCTNNLNLYSLASKDYQTIKESLMEINGIGDKVADCIALMGYGKMEAFPIDVWVKRTLERVYFRGRAKKIDYLHRFVAKRWPEYLGYAQQYIFWNGRMAMG